MTEWFWRCYQIKRPYIQRDHALSTKPVTFIDTVNVCAVHSLRYSRLSNLRKKYEQRENKLYIVSHIEHDHSRITNLNFHEIACFCEIMKMYTRTTVYVHSSLCDVVTYSIHLLIRRCLVRIHNASYSWSGPQLPKDCGCTGFMSPMHKKIPDSYL